MLQRSVCPACSHASLLVKAGSWPQQDSRAAPSVCSMPILWARRLAQLAFGSAPLLGATRIPLFVSSTTCLVWPVAAPSLGLWQHAPQGKQSLTISVQHAALSKQGCPPTIEVAAGRILSSPAQHLHLLDAQAPRQATSQRILIPCLQAARQLTLLRRV